MLLSSGEFAQLCNISRELLIHYDRIGLLKPKEIRENGYRYYSLKQLYLYDAIRFFMDAGMTTKEIGEYLAHRTTQLFLDNVEERIENMRVQRDVLDARIGMMEKMRYLTQRSLRFPKDSPRLSFWDELCFITTEVPRERSQRAYAQAVSEHARFCREAAGVATFPLGRVVDLPDARRPDDYFYTKIITWVDPSKRRERLRGRVECKPKGNYAVILHQGGTSTAAKSYAKLLAFVDEQGFEVLGPLYELDVNSYLMSDSADDYLLHVSVQVDVHDGER